MENFNHEQIPELFKNVIAGKSDTAWGVRYVVKGLAGDVAEIVLLDKNEWRFIIDNYPGQRKFYQTNFPFRSAIEFYNDMKRIGINLEFTDEAATREIKASLDNIKTINESFNNILKP
jgi:hypothetical protein